MRALLFIKEENSRFFFAGCHDVIHSAVFFNQHKKKLKLIYLLFMRGKTFQKWLIARDGSYHLF